ncbi:hypothetical protein KKF34_12055 [Myxococcota bacterium]|nr:hypothetical protein [Myxococcota bacterium]MBU1379796.1 hypothetical protein [Myxococcota bacterium]MBU1497597.1 hypothetical protein [Myxococcota bacterium]
MAIPPQEEGTIIYPVRNSNGHSYIIGKAYIIAYVDEDGTFKCKDPVTGQEGNWIKWEDVSLSAPMGWLWLKERLPPDAVSLLTLFDGVENLILKEEVKDIIIRDLPDLNHRLLTIARSSGKTTSSRTVLDAKNASILSFPKNSQTGEYFSLEDIVDFPEPKKPPRPKKGRKPPKPPEDDPEDK